MKREPTFIHRIRYITFFVTVALAFGFGPVVIAQDTVTGAFQGAVVHAVTGEPLEGVEVRITNEFKGVVYDLFTDKNGRFQGRLSGGIYDFRFSAPGFKPQLARRQVKVGLTYDFIPVPISLEPVIVKNNSSGTPLQTGSLVIGSLPNTNITVEAVDGTLVYQNTILIDELICSFPDIPAKEYVVTATLEGSRPFTAKISIAPRQLVPLTIKFQPNDASTVITTQAGKYYALIIGNNRYLHLSTLNTAENDAKEVDRVLRENYGFETKLLLNASREQIIKSIFDYRRRLEPNSNLLIYYGGHGYDDKDVEKAYWLPVNAEKEDNSNWISADDITVNIKAIPAKHILIVSDSCYSGTLSRNIVNPIQLTQNKSTNGHTARERNLLKMLQGKSRTLLASGGNEPVEDGGGGKYSVFAQAFISGLLRTDKNIFTAQEFFFEDIRKVLDVRAKQTPEYSPIRQAGQDGGDFVFIRKK